MQRDKKKKFWRVTKNDTTLNVLYALILLGFVLVLELSSELHFS